MKEQKQQSESEIQRLTALLAEKEDKLKKLNASKRLLDSHPEDNVQPGERLRNQRGIFVSDGGRSDVPPQEEKIDTPSSFTALESLSRGQISIVNLSLRLCSRERRPKGQSNPAVSLYRQWCFQTMLRRADVCVGDLLFCLVEKV